MAQSPSHRFGQIIGELLEEIMAPILQTFCDERGLYLDKKGKRGKVRSSKKLSWKDKYGNNHDLDFVIERGGTVDVKGRPLAFIEAAWRRYTKHSRNKAQEIQGAILPIAEEWEWDKPFLGAILAGVFTKGSLDQMKSCGFETALFSYESIVSAFKSVDIEAEFDEQTPDKEFEKTIDKISVMSTENREMLKTILVEYNKELLNIFFKELQKTLDRQIDKIILIPLHGSKVEFERIDEAILFINSYSENQSNSNFFVRYEVIVRYSNNDKIDASFERKLDAIEFLKYIDNGIIC